MDSSTSKMWDEVVAAGDAEDKLWGWSQKRRAVLRNEEVIEDFPQGTDWELIYERMEQLRKRAIVTTMCLAALEKKLIGSRKIELPDKKHSILDITRMFG